MDFREECGSQLGSEITQMVYFQRLLIGCCVRGISHPVSNFQYEIWFQQTTSSSFAQDTRKILTKEKQALLVMPWLKRSKVKLHVEARDSQRLLLSGPF